MHEYKRPPAFKIKGYDADIKDINKSEKSVTAYVSTITKDSYNEVVLPIFNLNRFAKNPVVLWAHEYFSPPIGRSLWQKVDKTGLLSKTQFQTKTQIGADIWTLYAEGFMNAFSIGYMPGRRIRQGDEAWGEFVEQFDFDQSASELHVENELWEYSSVPVPANPDAVIDAIKSGAIQSDRLRNAFEQRLQKHLHASSGVCSEKGTKLAARLNALIDELVTEDRNRSDIISDMADAANISTGTVNQILNAEINCPPLNRLSGFARVLKASAASLRTAAESDGCEYDQSNSAIFELLKDLSDKIDRANDPKQRLFMYQEALKIEQSLKSDPVQTPDVGTLARQQLPGRDVSDGNGKAQDVVLDFRAAQQRIPAIVEGAIKELQGKNL